LTKVTFLGMLSLKMGLKLITRKQKRLLNGLGQLMLKK